MIIPAGHVRRDDSEQLSFLLCRAHSGVQFEQGFHRMRRCEGELRLRRVLFRSRWSFSGSSSRRPKIYRRLKVLSRASIAYCRSYVLDQVLITVLCPIDCSGCAPTNGASSPPSTSPSIPAPNCAATHGDKAQSKCKALVPHSVSQPLGGPIRKDLSRITRFALTVALK